MAFGCELIKLFTFFVSFFLSLAGDKPAAMKHSNQTVTAESKSSSNAHANQRNLLLYSILSLLLIGVYSFELLDR
jgi:hypothetical protein